MTIRRKLILTLVVVVFAVVGRTVLMRRVRPTERALERAAKLDAVIDDLRFEDASLTEVLAGFQAATGARIVFSPDDVRDPHFCLHFHKVKLATALRQVLRHTGTQVSQRLAAYGDVKLVSMVDENAVVHVRWVLNPERVVLRVIDLRDLIEREARRLSKGDSTFPALAADPAFELAARRVNTVLNYEIPNANSRIVGNRLFVVDTAFNVEPAEALVAGLKESLVTPEDSDKILERKIPRVNIDDEPRSLAIAHICDSAGMNYLWSIDPDAPEAEITLHLWDVPLRVALSQALLARDTIRRAAPYTYDVEADLISVYPNGFGTPRVYNGVYDVRDLVTLDTECHLADPESPDGPQLLTGIKSTGSSGTQTVIANRLFDPGRLERALQLEMEGHVESGLLISRAPPDSHRAIRHVLRELRRTLAEAPHEPPTQQPFPSAPER